LKLFSVSLLAGWGLPPCRLACALRSRLRDRKRQELPQSNGWAVWLRWEFLSEARLQLSKDEENPGLQRLEAGQASPQIFQPRFCFLPSAMSSNFIGTTLMLLLFKLACLAAILGLRSQWLAKHGGRLF
jgi:hypothetical protein